MTNPTMQQCPNAAAYAYMWPGRGESYACLKCQPLVVGTGHAMGIQVPMVQLNHGSIYRCQQQTTEPSFCEQS